MVNRWGEPDTNSALATKLAAITTWGTTPKTAALPASQWNSTRKCRCNLRVPWPTDPLSISLNKCLLRRPSFRGTSTWCSNQIMGRPQISRVYTEGCSRLKMKICPTKTPMVSLLKLLVLSLTKCRKHRTNNSNTSQIWMKEVRLRELERPFSSRIRREALGGRVTPEDNTTNRIRIRPLDSGRSQETTRDQRRATVRSSCTILPAERPPYNSFELKKTERFK